ncbi:MAG: hypothetical protein LBQ12_14650, partial [Deltaproteobacteria bacterium]|nr:hypothetical protein [Deltaproteobacteria bacterium]
MKEQDANGPPPDGGAGPTGDGDAKVPKAPVRLMALRLAILAAIAIAALAAGVLIFSRGARPPASQPPAPPAVQADGRTDAQPGAQPPGAAGAAGAQAVARSDPRRADPQNPQPEPPPRTLTIWQNNAFVVSDPDRQTTVYEFSLSTRGSAIGKLEDIAIQTDRGPITVDGAMDGTEENGYRTGRLEAAGFVDSFEITGATATVDGKPGQDLMPDLRVSDYQPWPILLPGDPVSIISSVRYHEIPKFLVDAPVEFGSSVESPPTVYVSDFVEAAVEIYREEMKTELMIWNGATLLDRPVDGPYIVLFNRGGVNGFSVMEPSAGAN